MIDIDSLVKTPSEVADIVRKNFKKCRKFKKISQRELATRSGVSYGSLRRFESTGKISLENLLALAIVLETRDEFEKLFTKREYKTLQELIDDMKE